MGARFGDEVQRGILHSVLDDSIRMGVLQQSGGQKQVGVLVFAMGRLELMTVTKSAFLQGVTCFLVFPQLWGSERFLKKQERHINKLHLIKEQLLYNCQPFYIYCM